jgi:hypothetical protein
MMTNADPKYFTVQEANAAIIELRKTLSALRTVLEDIERMEERLEVLDLICNRAVVAGNADLQEYLALKIRYHQRISEFEGILQQMETEGHLLRDLDKGVVHFISRRGSDDVLLCWTEGEDTITHWHALEASRPASEDRRLEIEDWDSF